MCDPFSTDDPCGLGLEWVRARLGHDPRTRPLAVSAHAAGQVLVLEGQVSCLADKQMAGLVARKSQRLGWLDNRIVVVESNAGAVRAFPSRPLSRRSVALAG